MNDRSQRILIFFGVLVVALLTIILVVLLISDDEGTAVADTSSTTVVTTTEALTTTEASTTTEAPTTSEAAAATAATGTTAGTEPEPEPEPEPSPPSPLEVGRSTEDLTLSNPLGGVGSTPPFLVTLGAGFATSHDWWLVGTSPPGAIGCRDSSAAPVANPVDLVPLTFAIGQYGCSHMGDDHVAQLHVITVERDPDRVIVEVVVWDLTP